jgi:hypothetical protein
MEHIPAGFKPFTGTELFADQGGCAGAQAVPTFESL